MEQDWVVSFSGHACSLKVNEFSDYTFEKSESEVDGTTES